jgi:NADPH:quinone reductase-like Zn-dependent oxidoreductase
MSDENAGHQISRFVVLVTMLGVFATAPLRAVSPDIATTTRKVVLEKSGAGYRWKLTEAPVPAVGDRQVLIRVHAVGLNRGDLSMLEPDSDNERVGRVAASDAAGEVIAVGKQVKGIRKGARVTNTFFENWTDGRFSGERLAHAYGWTADGVLADYIALESTDVVPIPDELSYEEAATLPTAGVTAWNAVAGHRDIHPGDVVLVQGTGGVSTFATQFAAALGAHVIVTSSSDEKLLRVKGLGASEGINYKREPAWSERVLQLTKGHGADLVVDVGGRDTLDQSVRTLADAGTLSIVGGLSGYDGSISAWGLLKKAANAQSVFVGSRADYLRMNTFIVAHRLHPVIERVFPLEQYDEALKTLAAGNFIGKIVLTL